MRSTCRLFLAMTLLGAAVSASAQQDATPAPPLPVETPALSMAPSPQTQSSLPAADATPSPTAVPSPTATPGAKPLAAAGAVKPSGPPPEKKIAKGGKTQSSKISPKPAEAASSKPDESNDKAAAAAASTASIDAAGSTGSTPPSATAENPPAVPPPSIDSGTAPSPTSSQAHADKDAVRVRDMSAGTWVLAGIALLGVIGAIAFVVGHNGRDQRISILDQDLSDSRSTLAHTRLS